MPVALVRGFHELAGNVAPCMEEPHDDDFGVCWLIHNDVLPDQEAAKIRSKFRPSPPKQGELRKLGKSVPQELPVLAPF